jgi:hypothetical protein
MLLAAFSRKLAGIAGNSRELPEINAFCKRSETVPRNLPEFVQSSVRENGKMGKSDLVIHMPSFL